MRIIKMIFLALFSSGLLIIACRDSKNEAESKIDTETEEVTSQTEVEPVEELDYESEESDDNYKEEDDEFDESLEPADSLT